MTKVLCTSFSVFSIMGDRTAGKIKRVFVIINNNFYKVWIFNI